MRIAHERREGFALAIAIAAIVVIGAMIAGVFFASTQEFRIGRNTLLQSRALTAAEYGLNVAMAPGNWSGAWNTMSTGTVVTREFLPGDGSVDTIRLTKLNNDHLWLVSEGFAGSGLGAQARRRIGAMLALDMPQLNVLAALTTQGQIKVGGSSFIDGTDNTYAGWSCPAAGPSKPGIALPDSSDITTSGCGGLSCVNGSPKVLETPVAADTNTYFTYGSMNWSGLTAMSGNVQPAGVTRNGMQVSYTGTGACNTADPNNWGDPFKAAVPPAGTCEDYYPIIYATGDLKLTGGYGQGVLLVEGNLDVSGGFEFYGPVIVRGMLKTTGTGGHFNGGVMAANVDLAQNTVLGNAVVSYSSCTVMKALSGSATPTIARGRSWVEVY